MLINFHDSNEKIEGDVSSYEKNSSSIACLVETGLNSNFHWWAQWLIVLSSWFNSLAEVTGSLTIENNTVSSAKNLIFSLKIIKFDDCHRCQDNQLPLDAIFQAKFPRISLNLAQM